MDIVAIGQAIAQAKKLFHRTDAQTVTMPTGLGWTGPAFTATVQDMPADIRALGSVSLSPKAAFDAASTARTAPVNTYYVDRAAGSNANPGTLASPFLSIWKAIQVANAAGQPALIYVEKGVYERGNDAFTGGGVNTYPTVDIALVAKNGRVVTGTFDFAGTQAADATQTNTYSWTLSNCERVHDLLAVDRFGNHVELIQVATPAICNITPGSWCLSAGKIYVRRTDGAAVTSANTRLYRSAVFAGLCVRDTQVNIYVGGRENNSGFDFEGGTEGAVSLLMHTAQATPKTAVFENCSFKYGGGYTSTTGRSVCVETWNGFVYFANCRADAGWTDGFNIHQSNGTVATNVLTVNCSAYDNGRYLSQSNNGWTTHESVVGVDIAGHYVGNHGGTCRSINASKSWLAGTAVVDDYGDLSVGGSVPPTAFRTDDTAVYWLDRCRIRMPASTFAYFAYLSTAAIHLRNCWATALVSDGGGTIDTY